MKKLPKLCIHKPSQRYYIRINRQTLYLGPVVGLEEQAKAEAMRLRLLGEYRLRGTVEPSLNAGPTVLEIMRAYKAHAETYYRKRDGSQTSEYGGVCHALKPLCRLYGETPAAEFGPIALEVVRAAMLDGRWMNAKEKAHPSFVGGWCRNLTNQNVGRILRAFRWAVSRQLIPVAVVSALECLPPLTAGRSAARERPKVPPAPEATITAVLTSLSLRTRQPVLPSRVADMMRVQLLTGARPGEVCSMRPCDLDRTGEALAALLGSDVVTGKCWAYIPGLKGSEQTAGKTLHHGRNRIIPVGPQARDILGPYLEGRPMDRPIFSPGEARAEWDAARKAGRRTPHTPSSRVRKRKANPRKSPGATYTTGAYCQAVGKACAVCGIPRFHPHQLRHNAATRLERQFGIEVARVVLGHKNIDITRVYVADDFRKAFAAMEQAG